MTKASRLGKLPPRYSFILNPYTDARFTRCPGCDQPTKVRKLPLFIHVDPLNPVVLGKTCRYCPDCDLLIVHQDELEVQLRALFDERDPSLVGNDYLAEIFTRLRRHNYQTHVAAHIDFGNMTGRNQDAVKKTTAGLPKLVFPHRTAEDLEPDELNLCLSLATECRQRVLDQLAQ